MRIDAVTTITRCKKNKHGRKIDHVRRKRAQWREHGCSNTAAYLLLDVRADAARVLEGITHQSGAASCTNRESRHAPIGSRVTRARCDVVSHTHTPL